MCIESLQNFVELIAKEISKCFSVKSVVVHKYWPKYGRVDNSVRGFSISTNIELSLVFLQTLS